MYRTSAVPTGSETGTDALELELQRSQAAVWLLRTEQILCRSIQSSQLLRHLSSPEFPVLNEREADILLRERDSRAWERELSREAA